MPELSGMEKADLCQKKIHRESEPINLTHMKYVTVKWMRTPGGTVGYIEIKLF